VGKDVNAYALLPLASEIGGAGYRLVRSPADVRPGEPVSYDVHLDGAFVTCGTCECAGFLRWGWRRTPEGQLTACKHLDALLALTALGKLPPLPAPAPRPSLTADFA
jgi:hypothetical protein